MQGPLALGAICSLPLLLLVVAYFAVAVVLGTRANIIDCCKCCSVEIAEDTYGQDSRDTYYTPAGDDTWQITTYASLT